MIAGFNGPYRFLSNFYTSPIEFEGISYATVEHAYQAAKTTDPDIRAHIASLDSPGAAKRFGRSLVLREDWDAIKLEIMRTLLRKKFYNLQLAHLLINTNNSNLVEANYWHDNFWGSCRCDRCVNSGENHLGRLLMETRAQLVANYA